MSIINKGSEYQKWFDGFAKECGEYAAFHEYSDPSACFSNLPSIEAAMPEFSGSGIFSKAKQKGPENEIWAEAALYASQWVRPNTKSGDGHDEIIGDMTSLKKAPIDDYVRALLEGKNIGSCQVFDAPPGEDFGPYYVANRDEAFGQKTGGVDPMLFNVVMCSIYAEERTTSGLDGPASPGTISSDGWRITKHKDGTGQAFVAAQYILPYADETPIYGNLSEENLKGLNFKMRAIAPYEEETKGLNTPRSPRQIAEVASRFTKPSPAFWETGTSVVGLGAGTPGDLELVPASDYSTYKQNLLYIDSISLMDTYMLILTKIGKSNDIGRSAGRGKLEELIRVFNKDYVDDELRDSEPPAPPASSPFGESPANYEKRELKEGSEVHAFDVQCYLLENIKKIAALREANNYKKIGKISSAMPGNIVSKIHHGAALETEKTSNKTAWPPSGAGPDNEAYQLQNICPDLWALMVPHIELYRVDYSGKDKLVPSDEHRIPFKNYVDPSNIKEITAGTYGRIGGAGIKSFSWSLDGVQPAEVDNVISADLVMHFQSVYDLFRLNKVPGTDDDYAAGQDTPGYLDLIIGSGTTVSQRDREKNAEESNDTKPNPFASPCGISSEIYDGAAYRIKAVVGWATPPNFTNLNIPGYNTLQLAAIERAVTSSRVALYLQIVSHAINFQQNGSLELAIKYQASLSGMTRAPDADIFIAKELHSGEIEQLEDELEKHRYTGEGPNRKSRELAIRNRTGGGSSAELSEYQRVETEIQKKIISFMKKSRLHKYSIFLDMLTKKNKVYGIRVPTTELLNPLKDMGDSARAEAAKTRQGKDVTVDRFSGETESQTELTSLVAQLAADGDGGEKDTTQDAKLKAMADEVGIVTTGNSDTTLIPFMYLGDLIDVLFEERLSHLVDKNGAGISPLQMLLGTVELVDPLAAYQVQTVNYDCGNGKTGSKRIAELDPLRFRKITGITQYMNIGSIPISLDKFNEWFMNDVIVPKKDSYFLLNFIKDVCAGLVSKAYNEVCFEGLFQFNVRFDTATFRLADNFAGKRGITLEQLAQSSRKAKRKDKLRLSKESSAKPSIPSIIVYSVDSRPNTGDRATDMQEGIYHYFLGGRCGLASEINFNRQDMPFYREARISKDGSLGAQQLKELYSIDMKMIGNSLHKNGTFVYVDPIAIGAGSSRAIGGIPNIARLIGLGGYFLVTKVNHEISPSGYSTHVGGIQQMSAFDMTMNEAITGVDHYSSPTPEDANDRNPEDDGYGGDDDAPEDDTPLSDQDNDIIGDSPTEDTGAGGDDDDARQATEANNK